MFYRWLTPLVHVTMWFMLHVTCKPCTHAQTSVFYAYPPVDCSDISDDPLILHLVSTKLTLTIHADGVAGRGGEGDKSPLTEYL